MRHRICLNGEWDFAPHYNYCQPPRDVASSWRSAIRPEQEFQPYDLFNYPEHWNQAQSGVVRRTFTAGHKPGERCFLVLNGVMQRFVVFVNGREVAASQESFLPVEVDVTEALVMETENDLRIW